ncbi:hypothetical protein DEO72_LG2g3580 [Vigna unguiculata]|uniref:Uncharacterized protein n=1 Tax=Vigna unguiculata TaxID=3917 RepID=A0A4D6L3Y6_VIGUN|nr:hypothetical protein DEO72_LG2g3580 [Vigna unguiculata]
MQNLDRDTAAALPSPLALTGDVVALRFTPRKTLLHLRLLFRFSSAFKIGAAPIHFAAVRSRSPDTAVSGFSRLKVVVGPAVTVEGNASTAGARGLRGSSSRDHHSSVHVTTRDHTPVQSFESPAARVSLLLTMALRMGTLRGWIGKPRDGDGERVFRCVEDANRVRMNEQRKVRIGG